MTVGQISAIFKKISVAFLFAFCFQSLDVYGCKDCCEKCCEDCCKNCCGEELFWGKDLTQKQIESLVSQKWYEAKKTPLPVLKIVTNVKSKTGDEGVKDKITIKDGKIEATSDDAEQLKLADKTYALFKIKKENEKNPIYLYCSDIGSVSVHGIFQGCTHTEISVIACDTQNVANMRAMFYSCTNLEVLNINSFDTSNVVNMYFMFATCFKLKNLKLENFNTGKVTSMNRMFYECSALKTLDLSNFDTRAVKSMAGMFAFCYDLLGLDLSNFDTQKVTNMERMFWVCENLKDINITDAFLGNGSQSMENMFDGCTKLEKIVNKGGIEISSPGDVINYLIEKHKNK